MPVPQRLLLETIKARCEDAANRFPGYRSALFDSISQIVEVEAANAKLQTNVVQRVSDICTALADLVEKNDRASAKPPGQAESGAES